jgi:hypothetical protein
MKDGPNDWRMRDVAFHGEDWVSPWTGQYVPKGTQITVISVIQLRKDKQLTIAVPNATALCISISRRSWEESRKIRSAAGIDKSLKTSVSFENHATAFDFIERVMEAIVMAYTGIEAYVNENIPDDFTYEYHKRSDTILETINKEQIERTLSTDEKLDQVLPRVFSIESPKGKRAWHSYKKLKEARDRVIHMKSDDRRSSGPDHPTLWHEVFKVEPPHSQAIELIEYFVGKTGVRTRWLAEYVK